MRKSQLIQNQLYFLFPGGIFGCVVFSGREGREGNGLSRLQRCIVHVRAPDRQQLAEDTNIAKEQQEGSRWNTIFNESWCEEKGARKKTAWGETDMVGSGSLVGIRM